jgi:hypothetical protein
VTGSLHEKRDDGSNTTNGPFSSRVLRWYSLTCYRGQLHPAKQRRTFAARRIQHFVSLVAGRSPPTEGLAGRCRATSSTAIVVCWEANLCA